jgi:HD-like signal output (HDOD) protein
VAPVPAEAAAELADASPESAQALTEAALRDRIAERLHALLSELPPALQRTDAPVVLGRLAETLDTSIGQPAFAAQRALSVSRNQNSSVNEVARLFEGDPGLAQSLLRHANSSYYSGMGGTCASLATAVQRIGSAGVENVLLASIVQGMLCRPGSHYDALVKQVWSHMVRSAPIARDIARAFDLEPERAFALALLHDAGKLIVFENVSSFRRAHRREVNIPHHFMLWALKRLHEPLGGLAASRWGLPQESARAIAIHHREPPPEEEDRLSQVIYVAEKLDLCSVRANPPDVDAMWEAGRLTGDREAVRWLFSEGDRSAA